MKMKKIAAILTALSVLSGCAGNTVTEETTTTTGTTEAVTTATATEAEISETRETTTEKDKDQISKENSDFDSTKGPEPAVTPPSLFSIESAKTEETKYPLITVTSEQITTNSAVVDEVVKHIELNRTNHFSKYTELYGTAILLITKNEIIRERFEIAHPNSTFGGIAADLDVLGFFESPVDYPSDPNTSFVKEWGCNPSHIFNNITNYEDGVYQNLLIDLTNSAPETLYEYIDKGTPVMVWVTEGLAEPELFAEYEGNKMYNPKECVVLAGYSDTAVCVWSVIEEKYVTYDRALFEQRYAEMGSMALTVVAE